VWAGAEWAFARTPAVLAKTGHGGSPMRGVGSSVIEGTAGVGLLIAAVGRRAAANVGVRAQNPPRAKRA